MNSFSRVFITLWVSSAPFLCLAQAKNADNTKVKQDTIIKTPVLLKEVSITGKKDFIEQKIDRTVLNVDGMVSATGTNALDLLEKAPGVTVDQDGNISLKGQQGVLVLIDNRPVYLSASALAAYLKSMPSGNINQVEIITNPPARYDAAGSSGIINIRTKKSMVSGLNGSVTAGGSYSGYWKHNESANINYRVNKLNFFANTGYNSNDSWRKLDINRWFYDSDNELQGTFRQSTIFKPQNHTPNIKAGVDFYANDKTTWGMIFTGSYNRSSNLKNVSSIAANAAGMPDSVITALNRETSRFNRNGVNMNYSHKYDSLGRAISFDLDYIAYDSGNEQTFANEIRNSSSGVKTFEDLLADLPALIEIYSAKTDYEHPLKGKSKLGAGLKSSFVNTDNVASYFIQSGSDWLVDNDKTNHFRYKENINSIYLNFNKEFARFSLQTGLRMEQTNMNGHQLGNSSRPDSVFSQHYASLFPTLYLSYKLDSSANKLNFSYGRRVSRPYYQDLNPFIFLLDKFTYFAGNPYLRPEFGNRFEVSFNHKNKLTLSLFYNYNSDMINETIDQKNGIFISHAGNIGRLIYGGMSANLNLKAGKWWTGNFYGEAIRNSFKGFAGNPDLVTGSLYGYFTCNSQFILNRGWSLELAGVYLSPSESGQFDKKSVYFANAGVQKKVLADKGSIKFAFRDMFRTNMPSGNIIIPNTAATYHNEFDSRAAALSFTYNFSKGADAGRKHAEGADAEQNRVK